MSGLELVPNTGEELPSQQIARRIRGLMAENQITGTRMAQEIGLDQRAFSRRYRGATAWSIDELSVLARALRMPFEELVRHQGLEPRTRWLRPALSGNVFEIDAYRGSGTVTSRPGHASLTMVPA